MDDLLVTGLCFKDKLVDVAEVLELVEDDAEVGGQGIFEWGEDFELGLLDGLLVDGDG